MPPSSSPKSTVPRLQILAYETLKKKLNEERKTNVSPKRKTEIRELTDMIDTMKLVNRTTRAEEAKLREKSLARKVINKMRPARTFTGTRVRIGYPNITEYTLGRTKFRLTSNNLYYTDYTKPDLIKSMEKKGNKITIELDLVKLRDSAISRNIVIDIPTRQVTFSIIRFIRNPINNIVEVATDDKMKFEIIP